MFRRRPPQSALVFFGLALACGIAAALAVRAYAQRLEATRPDGGPPVGVLAATRDLPRGTSLTTDDLHAVDVPSAFAPPGSVRADDDVAGRTLAADVAAGEVLTRARLAGGSVGPVAALVPPGMRAVVIPTSLPAGSVRAGDVVDVFGAFGGAQPHVETAAEAVEVAQVLGLGTGGSGVDASTPTGPSLVLLVDPSTAERLAFAAAFATLVVAVDPPPETGLPTPSASVSAAPSP